MVRLYNFANLKLTKAKTPEGITLSDALSYSLQIGTF
jgi:hypothetical protein